MISLLIKYLVLITTQQKDIVKEGQVLCYIEQLGGQIPVEVNSNRPIWFLCFSSLSLSSYFVLAFFLPV